MFIWRTLHGSTDRTPTVSLPHAVGSGAPPRLPVRGSCYGCANETRVSVRRCGRRHAVIVTERRCAMASPQSKSLREQSFSCRTTIRATDRLVPIVDEPRCRGRECPSLDQPLTRRVERSVFGTPTPIRTVPKTSSGVGWFPSTSEANLPPGSIHSACWNRIGYVPPVEYEEEFHRTQTTQLVAGALT